MIRAIILILTLIVIYTSIFSSLMYAIWFGMSEIVYGTRLISDLEWIPATITSERSCSMNCGFANLIL